MKNKTLFFTAFVLMSSAIPTQAFIPYKTIIFTSLVVGATEMWANKWDFSKAKLGALEDFKNSCRTVGFLSRNTYEYTKINIEKENEAYRQHNSKEQQDQQSMHNFKQSVLYPFLKNISKLTMRFALWVEPTMAQGLTSTEKEDQSQTPSLTNQPVTYNSISKIIKTYSAVIFRVWDQPRTEIEQQATQTLSSESDQSTQTTPTKGQATADAISNAIGTTATTILNVIHPRS